MWLPICKLHRPPEITGYIGRQSTTEIWHFITNFGFLFFRSTWTPRNHRIHWRRDYSTGPNCDLSLQGCRRKSIGRDIMVQVRIKNISTCIFIIARNDFKSYLKKKHYFFALDRTTNSKFHAKTIVWVCFKNLQCFPDFLLYCK